MRQAAGCRGVCGLVFPEPKVEQLHLAIRRQHDVRRLQVPVDDSLLVGSLERVDDLCGDREGLIDVDPWSRRVRRLADQAFGKRLAVDELEGEELRAIRFVETMNRGDIGMIQGGEDLRFALESCEPVGIKRECVGENLERDVAIQFGIARAIHLAHSARTDGSENLVGTKASAGCQRHASRLILAMKWPGAKARGRSVSSPEGPPRLTAI